MSKDKKRKFQAIFKQNPTTTTTNSPVTNIIHSDEATYHRILKNDLLKVFILTFVIVALFIGLFMIDQKTGQITHFAEHITSYIIK